jgi:heat shock protein HtpX
MDFRKLQSANKIKSTELLFGMAILIGLVVWALLTYFGNSGIGVVPIAIGIALLSVWGSYWASDTIVLTMTGARLISESDNKQLYDLVTEVCIAASLPVPKIAIVEDDAPNAFATGRNHDHAVIAFTTGILRVMDREELQGVAAHELAHVANRDTLVSAIAATTAGALALLSDFMMRIMIFGGGGRRNDESNNQNPIALIASLIILILAPLAALLLRLAISRKREALADATAVAFTRNPTGLRRALEVLERDNTVVHQRSNAIAHMWIESPLDGSKTSQLFSTHPPLAERIATLRAMEGSGKS